MDVDLSGARRVCSRALIFMRRVLGSFVALLILIEASGGTALQPTEYQIKAVFLYNFAKFTEWPESAFPTATSPICIGVLGDDPFDDNLELTVAGKQINNRPLIIKRFTGGRRFEPCHILFVSRSDKREWPRVLETLRGSATLTVGDGLDQFCQQGGMINLIMAEKKVRFEINQRSAESAGLKISSRLLKLGVAGESPRGRE